MLGNYVIEAVGQVNGSAEIKLTLKPRLRLSLWQRFKRRVFANNLTVSVAGRNAALNAVTALINVGGAGSLTIYTGTQPTNPDTALSGNTALVTLTFSSTSFGSSSSGTATANTITSGTAGATGTATFARMFAGNGTTAVMDCTVGASGCDLNLPTATINSGDTVSISSFTLTHP